MSLQKVHIDDGQSDIRSKISSSSKLGLLNNQQDAKSTKSKSKRKKSVVATTPKRREESNVSANDFSESDISPMNKGNFGLVSGGKSGIELITDKNDGVRDLFANNPLAYDSSEDSDMPEQERRNRDLLDMEMLKDLKPNQAVKFKRVKHTIDFLVKENIVKADADTQVIEMLKSDLGVKLIKKQTCGEKFKLAFCSKRQKRKINELSLEN